jgi:G patch domain-containing protein 1
MRGSMGIGVLNEDDDEDPYDVGMSRSEYSRTVVPKREKVEKHTFKAPAKHTFATKSKSSTSSSSVTTQRGHDGRLPLPGFTLSQTPFTLTDKWYISPTPTNIGSLPP